MRVSDPVCGMALDAAEAPARIAFEGRAYHFCAIECERLFEQNPRRFIDPDDPVEGGKDGNAAAGSAVEKVAPAAPRLCLIAGHESRALPGQRGVGRITLEEFEAIVRAEWRHRLGRRSYARHHPRELIRALLMHALEPGNESRSAAVQDRLTEEIARLRVAGLSRAQVQRELYHLAHVIADVLRQAGVPLGEVTKLAALMERRLATRLEWQDRWAPIQDAWALPG